MSYYNYQGDQSKLLQNPLTVVSDDNSAIMIMPNPALDGIHLQFNHNYKGDVHISVFTLEGRKVSSVNIQKTDLILDYNISTGKLTKDFYMVEVRFGGIIIRKKVIVN